MQIILNKSYIVEKVASAHDKAGVNQQNQLAQQAMQEHEKRSSSINETKESESKDIDTKEKEKREKRERERRERKKRITKKLRNDSGHIIDLEA